MDPAEESMAVEPSEDQGNTPLEDTPSEQQPAEQAPAQEETQEEPAQPAEESSQPATYELPDGRKVTADELYKEHTENLLPEFTRRSQKLSELESKTQTDHSQPEKENPYADPNYIPQTYEEIIAAAEERALARIEGRERQAIETRQAVEGQVASEIEEIKKTDPNVNTDQLFAHAVKYGFSDLKAAHQNMKDMSALIEKTQKVTAQNVTKRTDPVSKTSQPSGTKPHRSQFASAADYLQAIKSSS